MPGGSKNCTIEGCPNRHLARGYCAAHYSRWQKNPDTVGDAPLRYKIKPERGCVIAGCERRHYCYRMCGAHYSACLNYGLSPIQLQMMYDRGCEICGKMSDLAVDHDHDCCPRGNGRKCGYCVRGVLCRPCNMAIGALGDDPKLIFKAFEYVRLSKHGNW